METKKFELSDRTNELVKIYELFRKLEIEIENYAEKHIPANEIGKIRSPLYYLETTILKQVTNSVKHNLSETEGHLELKL